MANFISIEKGKRKSILEEKIDLHDYMGLKGDRGRLITYGISLGIDYPVPLTSKDSLYRPEYINPEMKAMMVSSVVSSLDNFENLNDKLSDAAIADVTDAYLNRGLDVISDRIDNEPEQNLLLKKISDLDKLYKENVK